MFMAETYERYTAYLQMSDSDDRFWDSEWKVLLTVNPWLILILEISKCKLKIEV